MKSSLKPLLCLIALECFLTWSDWNGTLDLLRIHKAALQSHAQVREALKQTVAATAGGGPAEAEARRARDLDAQEWGLLSQGEAVLHGKILWQALSLLGMVSILGFGFRAVLVSDREARRRGKAEAELLRERASLERRIEERTGELLTEVEVRRKAEERNRRQKRVLELLASDAPLEEIFGELAASVASQRRSWESAIHLVDRAERSLQLIGSSEVSAWLEHYLRQIGASFPDAPESVALTSGAPCCIASMVGQHRPWSEFLASNGIRSAWSFPLVLHDGAAGTLTVYSRLFGLPDEEDRELMDAAVRLASLVVDVHRMNRELQRKAYEDELTGVANRRAGEIRLEEAIADARSRDESFAVLWIDLDRFKRLNDVYGHAHGDRVLEEIAKRIAGHPHVNGSVARMGGDEFLVLLASCSSEAQANEAAMELNAALREPIQLGSETATVGASIGITMFPRDGQTPDELERHADAAMYEAKRQNVGWQVFSPSLRNELDWSISVEEGLHLALEPGQNLLEVHYQPIYGTSGELKGFEALLRFRHPELGSISPAQFIPVAEESKLIIPIGRWVLRHVCRQIADWKKAGYATPRISVNISAVQWGREEFVQEIKELIRESGIPATLLALELTESVVMQNASLARAHMRELRKMGVDIAMDDFGTGYSSLSHLHQLPLDALKIDRSFIARLGQEDDSRTIVESVISMAHVLGVATVAEGVETEMQRRILTELNCDSLQGYLFARPLPGAEAARLMVYTGASLATHHIAGRTAEVGGPSVTIC